MIRNSAKTMDPRIREDDERVYYTCVYTDTNSWV